MRKLTIPSVEEINASLLALGRQHLQIQSLARRASRFYVSGTCSIHADFHIDLKRLLAFDSLGCPKCNKERISVTLRADLASVIPKAREVHGDLYEYLQLVHKDTKAFITSVCRHHGEFTQLMSNHLNGAGCPVCGDALVGLQKRISFAEWVERAKKVHGDTYVYTGVTYPNKEAVMHMNCKIHGPITMLAKTHTAREGGCLLCWREGGAKSVALKSDDDFLTKAQQSAKATKYTIVGVEGQGLTRRLLVECPEHGIYRVRPFDFTSKGVDCAKCANGSYGSKLSKAIATMLVELGVEFQEEARLSDDRYRWDIVVPSAKLAIETDGVYWHSTAVKSDNNSLKLKATKAQTVGYRQINLWEDEILDKPNIVKNLLASALHIKPAESHGARTCKVVDLSPERCSEFFSLTHIQGSAAGSVHRGLVSGGQLVAAMVLSLQEVGRSGKRSNTSAILQRYATSTSVPGGFAKLLSSFLKDFPLITTVTTYSDDRLFTGDTYKNFGFVKVRTSDPDYHYVKATKRIHKRSRQKSWFKSMQDFGITYDPALTERQLAEVNGYFRLYDRGLSKWVLTR